MTPHPGMRQILSLRTGLLLQGVCGEMETQGFACELGETEEPADSTQIQSEHGEDAAELEDDDCFGGALSDVREAERE